MSSPCLSGSRPYLLDLELVKSPSTSARASQTSSPSSTLSESGTSPVAISTRKPRTTRKRPNQTYNEAAALLSTAYPTIFSTKQLSKPSKFHKPHYISCSRLAGDSSELLLPFGAFDNSVFLLHQPVKDSSAEFFHEPRVMNLTSPRDKYSCQSSCSTTTTTTTANTCEVDSMEVCGGLGEEAADFDAESMLDDEENEGINSILGNMSVSSDQLDDGSKTNWTNTSWDYGVWCPGPIGLSLGGRNQFGMRTAVARALRRNNYGNFPNSPVVDMLEISPKFDFRKNSNSSPISSVDSKSNKSSSDSNSNSNQKSKSKSKSAPAKNEKKKKKKKVEGLAAEVKLKASEGEPESPKESPSPDAAKSELRLKLNYDEVLTAWSGRGMPFPDDVPGAEGTDVSARIAQIDLFSDNGGLREASVLRYKEKRRTRLFSKKIRYQVRKVNADRRPRMKGRFVRRPNGSSGQQPREEQKTFAS